MLTSGYKLRASPYSTVLQKCWTKASLGNAVFTAGRMGQLSTSLLYTCSAAFPKSFVLELSHLPKAAPEQLTKVPLCPIPTQPGSRFSCCNLWLLLLAFSLCTFEKNQDPPSPWAPDNSKMLLHPHLSIIKMNGTAVNASSLCPKLSVTWRVSRH